MTRGGVNGHRVNLISLDDGYSPPKTVEATRRLVEEEGVVAIFASLGTAPNSAIAKYLNQKGVPDLFISSGASKWGDYKQYPFCMAGPPSYRIEGQIYAKYILQQRPNAKIAVLWQNDDLGKDYISGIRDRAGRSLRQDRRWFGFVRGHRRHDRQPGRDPQILRCGRADHRRDTQIRRHDHSQGL